MSIKVKIKISKSMSIKIIYDYRYEQSMYKLLGLLKQFISMHVVLAQLGSSF